MDGGGRYIAAGGAGPGSEQPHGSPRCGAGQLRPPARLRRELPPSRARWGLPRGRGSAEDPPLPGASGRGAIALGSLRNPTFWRETRKKTPHQAPKPPWGPGGSCPPRTETPNLPAPQSSAAAGTSLPAGIASAATPLRLFLSSFLLLLSPSPCCLGLFMEIHSFMPSHRSLSVSLPPGGRACDASPLSSHFLLSQSGAAPTPGGGRAGTRVGRPGRGSIPQCGVGMRGRGHRPSLGDTSFLRRPSPRRRSAREALHAAQPTPRRCPSPRRRSGSGWAAPSGPPRLLRVSLLAPTRSAPHSASPLHLYPPHTDPREARRADSSPERLNRARGELGRGASTAPPGSPLCPAGYTVQSFLLPIAPLPLRFRGAEDPFLPHPPSILLPAAPRCLHTTAGEVPGVI